MNSTYEWRPKRGDVIYYSLVDACPVTVEGRDYIKGNWFSEPGYMIYNEHVPCGPEVTELPWHQDHWRILDACLDKRHPYSLACKPGECGTKTPCEACLREHLHFHTDPRCIDHG